MGNSKIKHYVVENRIEELSALAEEIDELTDDSGISPGLAMDINQVLEEALSNFIFYSFPGTNKHEIKISKIMDEMSYTKKIRTF